MEIQDLFPNLFSSYHWISKKYICIPKLRNDCVFWYFSDMLTYWSKWQSSWQVWQLQLVSGKKWEKRFLNEFLNIYPVSRCYKMITLIHFTCFHVIQYTNLTYCEHFWSFIDKRRFQYYKMGFYFHKMKKIFMLHL